MTESKPGEEKIIENEWMIRPCHIYNEEYSDCTSFKARFHQYFIYGENINCDTWKTDYSNCKLWRSNQDETAFKNLIESEQKRRTERLAPHYNNTVWKKREVPPKDWNKPLPEWMEERNKNTFLHLRAAEMEKGNEPSLKKHLCTIS